MSILIPILSLCAGVIIGFLGHKSHMCFIGGFRDYFIIRDKEILMGVLAFFITVRVSVIILEFIGVITVFNPSFRTMFFNSFIYVTFFGSIGLGLVTTLSGACPMRHHIQIGMGDRNSLLYILGLYLGIIVFYSIKTIFFPV